LTIVTEVSRDFIQLLQAFYRLGLHIIFYRSVIQCYVGSICPSHCTPWEGVFAFVSMYEAGPSHSRNNQSGGWRRIPFATKNRKLTAQHLACSSCDWTNQAHYLLFFGRFSHICHGCYT
jgi:hypothetical protein